MTDFSKLSDRELDARAGLLAGTVIIAAAESHIDHDKPFRIMSIVLRDGYSGIHPDRPNVDHNYLIPDDIPAYSTDLNAARELEQEIERRELQNPYLNTLIEVTGGVSDGVSWRMTTATARQRAEAFAVCVSNLGANNA